MIVKTQITARYERPQGEYNNGISLTIPDQAISPAELLRRYATGQPLGFKDVTPVYDDDGEVPEFYKMDKLDRLHAMQENYHNVTEKRDVYDSYIKEQQQKEAAKQAAQKETESRSDTQSERPAQRSEAPSEVK